MTREGRKHWRCVHTNVRDIGEHPRLYTELYRTCDHRSYDLNKSSELIEKPLHVVELRT